MRELNILFVEDYCWFIGNGLDFQLAGWLADRGHNVHLLACAPVPLPSDLPGSARLALHMPRVSTESVGGPGGAFLVVRKSMECFWQLSRQCAFDVVVLYQVTSGLPVQVMCELRRMPTLYYFLSPWHVEHELAYPAPASFRRLGVAARRCAQGMLLRRASKVLTASQYMKGLATEVAPRESTVVPHGVDVSVFHPVPDRSVARRRLGLPQDRHVVLTVRRLVRRMGLHNLVRAAKSVLRRFPQALFVVGGEGPLRRELEGLADEQGVRDSILFVGFVPADLLPAYYQAADVFVLPTAALEGFGIVMLEAMACGTPVVATPVGAIPELLCRVTPELLCKDASDAAIADGICLALSDPDGLARAGLRCRDFVVRNFSWDVRGPEMEAVLLETVTA